MAAEGKKEISRRRSLLGFGLRAVCFLLICILAMDYTLYVLTPKYDYGICSMVNYYFQPRDTVDVLVLGTSLAYSGVNTSLLWRDYGLAVYDLCGAEMPYWAIYYCLEEALKTQTPGLILLDAKPSVYSLPYSKKERVILSTYGIMSPVNRIRAIIASSHPDNVPSFVLGFPRVHNRYSEVTAEDFRIPTTNGGRGPTWKGFMETVGTDWFPVPEVKKEDEVKPLQEKQQYYYEKILQTAKDHGIQLVLVGFPTPDYAYDHPYYRATAEIAAEYGFSFWNFNEPGALEGLDYETHFADWQHLNTEGNQILSRELGQRIRDTFTLPDRRGQKRWASWERESNRWYSLYAAWKAAQEEDE